MNYYRKHHLLIVLITICLLATITCVLCIPYFYNTFLINRAISIYKSYDTRYYRYSCSLEQLQSCSSNSIEKPQIAFVALSPAVNNDKNYSEDVTLVCVDYVCKHPLADNATIWVNGHKSDHYLDYSTLFDCEYYPEGENFDPRLLSYGLIFKINVNFSYFDYNDPSARIKFALSYKGNIVTPIITLNKTTHVFGDKQLPIYVYPWIGKYFSLNPYNCPTFFQGVDQTPENQELEEIKTRNPDDRSCL